MFDEAEWSIESREVKDKCVRGPARLERRAVGSRLASSRARRVAELCEVGRSAGGGVDRAAAAVCVSSARGNEQRWKTGGRAKSRKPSASWALLCLLLFFPRFSALRAVMKPTAVPPFLLRIYIALRIHTTSSASLASAAFSPIKLLINKWVHKN